MGKTVRVRRTKDDIVRTVSSETGFNRNVVDTIMKSIFDNIMFEVSRGNEVQFSGFGMFEPKERAARTGRNPHTKEPVPIPARVIPNFKAGERFKNVAVREIPSEAVSSYEHNGTTN